MIKARIKNNLVLFEVDNGSIETQPRKADNNREISQFNDVKRGISDVAA